MKSDELIRTLSNDLKPVKVLKATTLLFWGWGLLCGAIVFIEFQLTGGFRQNAMEQLASSPRFLFETLSAFLVFALGGFGALASIIPDDERSPLVFWGGPLAFTVFFAFALYDLFDPAMAPSSEHHRQFCDTLIILFSVIPAFILVRVIKSGAPTSFGWTGALTAMASLALPMTLMQLGCMYDPAHIILHHIVPVVLLSLLAVSWGRRSFAWRK